MSSKTTKNFLQRFAWATSQSPLLRSGKTLWEMNKSDSQLSLSKVQKVIAGIYLILHDFSKGIFPPSFEDQQKVYDNEINYSLQWLGLSIDASFEVAQMKPFWFNQSGIQYLSDFIEVMACLEKLKVCPPMKLLEIGCGTGWMSEFLATMGFEVVGTTLSPHDIISANRRIESLKAKGFDKKLSFKKAPMESLAMSLEPHDLEAFDCIFVYEALHHAYDWQQAIQECFKCLKPGGWLLICKEPNLIHTMVSYRVSVLTETHEIGFNRKKLIDQIKKSKFCHSKILKNRFSLGVRPIWIAAQK